MYRLFLVFLLTCTALLASTLIAEPADRAEQQGEQAVQVIAVANSAAPGNDTEFVRDIRPFLEDYCVSCHGPDTQKADFFLHDIDGDIANRKDATRWNKIFEFVSLGDMPPAKYKLQPTREERDAFLDWLSPRLSEIGLGIDAHDMQLPKNANRVSHEDLFSGAYNAPAYSRSRLFRISPFIFNEFSSGFFGVQQSKNVDGNNIEVFSQPFGSLDGKGITSLDIQKADSGTLSVLWQTARTAADRVVLGERYEKRQKRVEVEGVPGQDTGEGKIEYAYRSPRENRFRLPYIKYQAFINAEGEPTDEQIAEVFEVAFKSLLIRPPSEEETAHYRDDLFRSMLETGGRSRGLRYLIMGLMMSPEFVYRSELGTGGQLPDGRRMLGSWELAYAISFALRDEAPDKELAQLANEDKLKTKEDVEQAVRRLLNEGLPETYWGFTHHRQKFEQIRILRFFQEYFGYHHAGDVFKEDKLNPDHDPKRLVKDADMLVLHTLRQDKDVLKTLLTTDEYFVHYVGDEQWVRGQRQKFYDTKGNGRHGPTEYYKLVSARNGTPVPRMHGRRNYVSAYGLEHDTWDYPFTQPFKIEGRSGMLTHPAWLTAYSLNFETDPVRRGLWVAEHLLGNVVPEVPIGVDAKVPEDHTKTLRQRFDGIIKEDACWRCHKKMNPYGDPFEVYDDFGRHRILEITDGPDAQLAYIAELKDYENRKRRAADRNQPFDEEMPSLHRLEVDGTTVVTHSPDPALNGEYKDVHEMMAKFAESDHVRQVFLRYMFRFFMGRNETLTDSPTLMAMDKTYVESGGSFKETLVTLLTSDSFLYRK